jgi:hypothetical protein
MEDKWEKMIEGYMKTCWRFQIEELPSNPYMKRPYLERTLLNLFIEMNKEELEKKVYERMLMKSLDEDELFILYWIYPILKKKNIRNIWEETKNKAEMKVLMEKSILWIIHYFQFYMICTELFYIDPSLFKNELDILYSSTNIKNYIRKHLKNKHKIIKFIYLHNEIIDLQKEYQIICQYIHSLFGMDEKMYFSEFAFHLQEKEIIQDITFKKKKWFSHFLCMSNFTE